MRIRNYQSGDEVGQLEVYQAAAAQLPNFKSVTLGEVQRRLHARNFDPNMRFYAEHNGQIVGYANFTPAGRVSFPWCRPGHEAAQQPLFDAMLQAMKQRGHKRALAAYRKDWPTVHEYFLGHGFLLAREMFNFVIDLVELPTPAAIPSTAISPLTVEDLPAVMDLGTGILRDQSVQALEKHLFHNPYFSPDCLFVLRSRHDRSAMAVGLLIDDSTYADPNVLDGNVPCFRLGAFGAEGLDAKRVKGFFSFLARKESNVNALGLDLIGYASYRLRESDDIDSLAAQAPSDAANLMNFYQRNFRRQGSFPVFEREL